MSIAARRLARATHTTSIPASSYDQLIITDGPVGYWTLSQTDGLTDRSGHGLNALSYNTPGFTNMPAAGETGTVFDGSTQYIEVADNDLLSVPTTGILTIEAWLRPDILEFAQSEGSGYVHWMGKGTAGQHEYTARLYNLTNSEQRPNRLSGYAFNLAGGLGAGSYEQDAVIAGEWIHYVLTINTVATNGSYPTGYTKLYKNGVLRDQDSLSEYSIVPANGTAPLRIATRDFGSYFRGAVAKVAVYNYELSESRLLEHYRAMVSPGQIVSVSTVTQLQNALTAAQPGQTIVLADGTYSGRFSLANKNATISQPIVIEGSNNAVIDAGSVSSNYAFHVSNCSYVTLRGFQIRGAQKSMVFDTVTFSNLDRLATHDCGEESILLRNTSCDNTIKNCTVYSTGLATTGYGEGIYIGQYYGNWNSTSQPDMSDRNNILSNHIYNTAAESIDIKEGTSNGLIQANILDGANMSGSNYADSWIDIAGNGYLVQNNIGTNALLDGIQTHTQPYPATTASNNIFKNNTLTVNASGYGIHIDTDGTGNKVYASNTVSGAGDGLTNITVTP